MGADGIRPDGIYSTAANQTALITIPILIPSNANALKGSYLESIEIDSEILVAERTSFSPPPSG